MTKVYAGRQRVKITSEEAHVKFSLLLKLADPVVIKNEFDPTINSLLVSVNKKIVQALFQIYFYLITCKKCNIL